VPPALARSSWGLARLRGGLAAHGLEQRLADPRRRLELLDGPREELDGGLQPSELPLALLASLEVSPKSLCLRLLEGPERVRREVIAELVVTRRVFEPLAHR
jgi:hypothetical protein